MSKSNFKLQVFGLFSRFVGTLIIKISSSEEPANSRSIHRVRNGGKLVIFFHPSPRSITGRCRSLSWKPAKARWKYQNGAERAEQIFLAHAQQNAPLLGRWQGNTHTQMSSFSVACRGHTARHCTKASRGLVDMKPRKQIIFNTRFERKIKLVRLKSKDAPENRLRGHQQREVNYKGSEKDEEVSRVLSGFSLTLRPRKIQTFFNNRRLILASVYN